MDKKVRSPVPWHLIPHRQAGNRGRPFGPCLPPGLLARARRIRGCRQPGPAAAAEVTAYAGEPCWQRCAMGTTLPATQRSRAEKTILPGVVFNLRRFFNVRPVGVTQLHVRLQIRWGSDMRIMPVICASAARVRRDVTAKCRSRAAGERWRGRPHHPSLPPQGGYRGPQYPRSRDRTQEGVNQDRRRACGSLVRGLPGRMARGGAGPAAPLVRLCCQGISVTTGPHPPFRFRPRDTTWMPRSCRTSSMKASSTP